MLSVHSGQGKCQAGRVLTCELGSLAAGAHTTITVVAKVQAAGEQINAASATSASRDPNSSNNLSAAKTKVTPRLVLKKVALPTVVRAGRRVAYRLKVTNPNSITLRHLQTCDKLPAGLTFVRASSKPRLSNGQFCWKLTALAPGRSTTYKITARALLGARGIRVNRAAATATGTPRAYAKAKVRVIAAPPRPAAVTG